ncbi:hypothetical protein FRC12_009678 [Ceratobasidium sp. 428]|nr:hypothetical protein FRC12_009678 [Ceratobasidium sp. 428]
MPPSSVSPPGTRPEPVWTEPPCSWFIETTEDALLILEAARRGLIPRVTRRLVDRERRMITSGSVFVFDEDESGIKRWTDGLLCESDITPLALSRDRQKRFELERQRPGRVQRAESAASLRPGQHLATATQRLVHEPESTQGRPCPGRPQPRAGACR